MSLSKFIFAVSLVASVALPVAARADTADCELRNFKAVQVSPLISQERAGRGTVERLRGAQLFVPAKQGLTAEWLQARAAQHVAQMQHRSMAGCPLGVSDIRVAVVPGGTGFWVQLSAKNTESAREVLRLAQAVVR